MAQNSLTSFGRPMDSSPDDRIVGMNDAGMPIYETTLGNTYSIEANPDQRGPREQIVDAWEGLKEWAKNDPDLLETLGNVAKGVWEEIGIPGDLASGEKSASDVSVGETVGMAPAMGAASTPFKVPEGSTRIFGGLNARTKQKLIDEMDDPNNAYENAREMKKKGVDDATIWEETGWQFDRENNAWQFEIDPKDLQFEPRMFDDLELSNKEKWDNFVESSAYVLREENTTVSLPLREVVESPKLFENYPILERSELVIRGGGGASFGVKENAFGELVPTVTVGIRNMEESLDEFLDSVTHELQHGVQSIEGWSGGANRHFFEQNLPEIRELKVEQDYWTDKLGQLAEETGIDPAAPWESNLSDYDSERYNTIVGRLHEIQKELNSAPFKYYQGNPGEIEARAAEGRRYLTEEELRETPPSQTKREMFNRELDRYRGKQMPTAPLPAERGYAKGGMVMSQPMAPGALSSDEKDTVDAKLAEGEFVIPANVVRFYGLDKFQKMIMKAEETMAELEGEGEMGGEPLPPDNVDSADRAAMAQGGPKGFAEGGLVYKDLPEFNPQDWANLGVSTFPDVVSSQPEATPEPKTEIINYVNDKGQIMPITFINGEPTQPIPPGFRPQDSTAPKQKDTNDGIEEERNKPQPMFGGKNPFELTREELLAEVDNMANTAGKFNSVGAGLGSMVTGSPLVGVAMVGLKANTISNMNRLAMVAEARGDTALAETIRGKVDEIDGDGLAERMFGTIASGQMRFNRDREQYIGAGNQIGPYSSDRSSPLGGSGRGNGGSDPVSSSSRFSGGGRNNDSDSSRSSSSGRSYTDMARDSIGSRQEARTQAGVARSEAISSGRVGNSERTRSDYQSVSAKDPNDPRSGQHGYKKGGLVRKRKY